jgi:hypothetical protein
MSSPLGRKLRKAKGMDDDARQQRVDVRGEREWVTFETGEFDTPRRAEWGPDTLVGSHSQVTTTTTSDHTTDKMQIPMDAACATRTLRSRRKGTLNRHILRPTYARQLMELEGRDMPCMARLT